jgi:DNA-binding response OmpR family regulator
MDPNIVLVVEDDPTLGPVVQRVLIRAGFQVLWAADGLEALRLWDAADHKIPVVLTDRSLPGPLSGEALARQINAGCPATKIVMVSGFEPLPDEVAQELRLFGYLKKPFGPAELLELVQRAFSEGSL